MNSIEGEIIGQGSWESLAKATEKERAEAQGQFTGIFARVAKARYPLLIVSFLFILLSVIVGLFGEGRLVPLSNGLAGVVAVLLVIIIVSGFWYSRKEKLLFAEATQPIVMSLVLNGIPRFTAEEFAEFMMMEAWRNDQENDTQAILSTDEGFLVSLLMVKTDCSYTLTRLTEPVLPPEDEGVIEEDSE